MRSLSGLGCKRILVYLEPSERVCWLKLSFSPVGGADGALPIRTALGHMALTEAEILSLKYLTPVISTITRLSLILR